MSWGIVMRGKRLGMEMGWNGVECFKFPVICRESILYSVESTESSSKKKCYIRKINLAAGCM